MLKKFLALALVAVATGCAAATANLPVCNKPSLPSTEQGNSATNKLGQLVMWNQQAFPIRVTLDPNIGAARRRATLEAIEIWNQETGQEVFKYVGDGSETGERGTVWITDKKLPLTKCKTQIYGLAYTYIERNLLGIKSYIDHAWIEFHTGVPDDRIGSTAIHELGHVLGLHHDPERHSIMFPYNHPGRMSISMEDIQYVIDMITKPRVNMSTISVIF